MKRLGGFVVGFAATTVLLTAVSVATARDWRPAVARPLLHPQAEEALPAALPLAVTQMATTVPADGLDRAASAWIVRPASSPTGGRPGAVLISGAGPGTRDALLAEARALAAAGLATIVYDKQAGPASLWRRDFGALATAALQAGEVLGRTPGVDPSRIGLIGWSEGGWVATEAARRAPQRVAFVGLISAPVVSPAAQLSWTARRAAPWLPQWGERVIATGLGAGRSILPWTAYDSRPGLTALDVPVVAVWGAEDPIVPVNEALGTVQDQVSGPLALHVVAGAGHELPVGGGHLERLAGWLAGWLATDGAATRDDRVRGVEPATALGVGRLPEPSWVGHPLGQVGISLVVATLAAALPRRRASTVPVPIGAHA